MGLISINSRMVNTIQVMVPSQCLAYKSALRCICGILSSVHLCEDVSSAMQPSIPVSGLCHLSQDMPLSLPHAWLQAHTHLGKKERSFNQSPVEWKLFSYDLVTLDFPRRRGLIMFFYLVFHMFLAAFFLFTLQACFGR